MTSNQVFVADKPVEEAKLWTVLPRLFITPTPKPPWTVVVDWPEEVNWGGTAELGVEISQNEVWDPRCGPLLRVDAVLEISSQAVKESSAGSWVEEAGA